MKQRCWALKLSEQLLVLSNVAIALSIFVRFIKARPVSVGLKRRGFSFGPESFPSDVFVISDGD